MSNRDIRARLDPWLERWSVDDLSHTDTWLQHMSVKSWAASLPKNKNKLSRN